jgi:hypothetical protein
MYQCCGSVDISFGFGSESRIHRFRIRILPGHLCANEKNVLSNTEKTIKNDKILNFFHKYPRILIISKEKGPETGGKLIWDTVHRMRILNNDMYSS